MRQGRDDGRQAYDILMSSISLTWGIAALTAMGVIIRPFGWPEAIWAAAGAALLVAFGMLSLSEAWVGVGRGLDVYLFLIGMMLLSELARREGLFDWLAAVATSHARGSPFRLFSLIYIVGTVVTVFLSNDATAVVLTPAVYAATKAARVKSPLPYLLICAFIANAASFVLPISNPANLVIFGGGHMPPLGRWLETFALPSLVAILATFAMLYWTQRHVLASETVETTIEAPPLSRPAKLAAAGLIATAAILIGASALSLDLGLPTFACGLLTAALIVIVGRESPIETLRGISWSVLPLVAGLFVVVQALEKTGLIKMLGDQLAAGAGTAPGQTAGLAGIAVAVFANLVNNLPAGLVAGGAVQAAHASDAVSGAILIGVDLGPNLSVTGSLATILWLSALRREGVHVGAWAFLKLGVLVMVPALLLSLAVLIAWHG
jgi:arsenical pump membrane protein